MITAKILSLFDLMQMYPTEESVIRYFESLRWGDKPVCVKCGCDSKITKQKNYKKGYWCGDCRSYFTAFTNTPLEHNQVRDVRKRLFASYLLMTARKGVSSLQLSKDLSVTQKLPGTCFTGFDWLVVAIWKRCRVRLRWMQLISVASGST